MLSAIGLQVIFDEPGSRVLARMCSGRTRECTIERKKGYVQLAKQQRVTFVNFKVPSSFVLMFNAMATSFTQDSKSTGRVFLCLILLLDYFWSSENPNSAKCQVRAGVCRSKLYV